MPKLILGTTGPSVFNDEIKTMIQDFYGACPLYITQDKEEDLEWVLKNINGLVLSGGRDITPFTYGKEITNHNSLSNFDYKRDQRELYLIGRCFELNIPILGICRGHQILGIYHKLYLISDIHGSAICHSPSAAKIELDDLPCHYVYINNDYKNGFFEKELVNSFHHQSLYYSDSEKSLKWFKDNGIEPIGYSYLNYKEEKVPEQKILELMAGIENRWISCQWHPECDLEYEPNQIILNKFQKMLG